MKLKPGIGKKSRLIRAGEWCPCKLPRSTPLPPPAFTLIELLVVIAIIALLAGLVLGGASIASARMRTTRAQAELGALTTAIDAYKAKKGYYPPCNVSNNVVVTTKSSLFYELTGVISALTNNNTSFHSQVSQENLTSLQVQFFFGTGGILNSSPDATEIQNFFTSMRKDQYGSILINPNQNPGPTYSVMTLSVHGPKDLTAGVTGSQIFNFWHYVSPNDVRPPQHNPDTYDLWTDILIAGKTNRISNWSKEPQIVNDWQD